MAVSTVSKGGGGTAQVIVDFCLGVAIVQDIFSATFFAVGKWELKKCTLCHLQPQRICSPVKNIFINISLLATTLRDIDRARLILFILSLPLPLSQTKWRD